jgi:hypothetical protein
VSAVSFAVRMMKRAGFRSGWKGYEKFRLSLIKIDSRLFEESHEKLWLSLFSLGYVVL